MHPLRHRALDPRDPLRVEAELQDVRRLGVPSELRVDHLVLPVRLPLDEVREPAPVAVDEAGLVDHVAPASHRLLGRACCRLEVQVGERDRDHLPPSGDELGEVSRLVLVSLPLDEVGLRILSLGPLDRGANDRELELRQVLALEERVQVRRREESVTVARLHE